MAVSNPPLDSQFTKGRFTGKVSIITGGASGIGRATVHRFVNDGAAVAVFDINESAGNKLQAELTAAGFNVKFYEVDVSVKEQCEEAARKVGEEHEGMIHFLVNNAGIGAPCKAENCAVVNVSSVQAHRAHPGSHTGWTYQASKGAITTMTRSMALDLSADGIRVNSISPGYTWTELAEELLGNRKDCEAAIAKLQMSRRFCDPAEVAAAIAFLCSKDASYITGTELAVDGGLLALGPEALGSDES